jgi:hypothetical protein
VNSVAITDLSDFLTEIKKIENGEYFRMHIRTLNGVTQVKTMMKDDRYSPTAEYIKDSSVELGWKKIIH